MTYETGATTSTYNRAPGGALLSIGRSGTVHDYGRDRLEHPEHGAEDIHWWTLDELHSTGEDLTPRDLAHRVRSLLEDGPPPRPMRVGR
jgi:hypothetical protein